MISKETACVYKQHLLDEGASPSTVNADLSAVRSFLRFRAKNDIAKLADVLGHSSIDTIRIYIAESAKEHVKILERLQLVT